MIFGSEKTYLLLDWMNLTDFYFQLPSILNFVYSLILVNDISRKALEFQDNIKVCAN